MGEGINTLNEVTQSLTVLAAVGVYAGSIKTKNGQQTDAHKQLLRFVNWCGADRMIGEIAPSDIGDYGEQSTGGSGGAQSVERLQEVKKFLAFAKKEGLTEHNLAQHLRIRKGRSRAKSDSNNSMKPTVIELTSEGQKSLVAEVEGLKAERAPIAAQIRHAAADKDVRENVPLEAAREHLGQVESRIQEIDSTLAVSVIVDPSQRKKRVVQVGSKVRLKDVATGKEIRYIVVSVSEAKPLDGKISVESPVGKAVIQRREGQEVNVQTPRGKIRYKILKVT